MNIRISNILTVASGFVPSGITIPDVQGLQEALDSKQITGNYVYGNETGNFVSTGDAPSSGDFLRFNSEWYSSPLTSGDIVYALGYVPSSGSGSGIDLPIQISDVDGLQSELDSKQASGNYAAYSDIISLQASKANLVHSHNLSDIVNSSGIIGSSNGLINVSDFGVSITGTPLNNTINFQKAIDHAIYLNRTGSSLNDVTVSVPATPSGTIKMSWPIFLDDNNITIRGEGSSATTIVSGGPAFFVGKHPRHWSVIYNTFDDIFNHSGNLISGSNAVSDFNFLSRVRSGSAISGVGVQPNTYITSVDNESSTFFMSKAATSTVTSNLFFYSGNVDVSGIISNGSPIISGINTQIMESISIGASVTGSSIQDGTYVLAKIDNSGMIALSKPSTGTSTTNLTFINSVNNSIIEISGICNAGSNVITGVSLEDIAKIGIQNRIHSLSLNGSLQNIYNANIGAGYFEIREIDDSNGAIVLSGNALDDYSGNFTITNGWFGVERHWEDVNNFLSGQLFPPGDMQAFPYAQVPGKYHGFRTRGNIGQFRIPGHSLCTGDPVTGDSAIPWPLHSDVTWEFLIYHHDAHLKGAIVGVGGQDTPDPWFLSGGGESNDPKYFFTLAVTDSDKINTSILRVTFPQNATVGLHLVTVQYNRDLGTIITWVDGIQKSSFIWDLSPFVGGFYPMEGPVLTKFNRIARWKYSEVVVGSPYSNLGMGKSLIEPSRESDFTLISMAAFKNAKYIISTPESAQQKIGGGNVDYSNVFFRPGYNSGDNDAIGWLTFDNSDSLINNSTLNINAKTFIRNGIYCPGFACPRGLGNHGTAGAIANPKIEGFNLIKDQGSPLSCGIYVGPFLYLRVKDIKSLKYFATIWCCDTVTSYDAYYEDMDLGSMVLLVNQIATMKKIKFSYPDYSAIRTSACQVHVDGFFCPGPKMHAEGFWTDFNGNSINAGIKIENGNINWEDLTIFPTMYHFYTQKRGDHGGNYFIANNVVWGNSAVPVIILDDINPGSRVDAEVIIQNSKFTGISPSVIVRGSDWKGKIPINNAAYFDSTIKYLPSISPSQQPDNPRLIGVDNDYFGPPVGGAGVVNQCHEIIVKKPVVGGVTHWVSKTDSPTGIRYEGTSNPPTWEAISISEGNGMNDVSINSFNNFYIEADLPWPTGKTTSLKNSSFQLTFMDSALNHILTGSSASNRSKFVLSWSWGLVNANSLRANQFGSFFYTDALNSKDYFNISTSGYRENTSGIPVMATNMPDLDLSLNRDILFGLHAGVNSSANAVFMGKTNPVDSGFWSIKSEDSFTLPSGSIRLKYIPRSGGWTPYAANKILNYFLDSSANGFSSPSGVNFPSGFYIGLSTNYANPSGTNITEVSGASYSRVYIPLNSGNWGRIQDYKEFWGNKSGVIFPVPLEDWGVIRSAFLSDSVVGGNIYHVSKINKSKRIIAGDDPVTFNPYAIQLQL